MENPKKISLRNKIALKLFDAYRHNAAKEHKLTYLFWECTLRCTLNCLHCGSDCRQVSSVKDMPIDDFINAVKQIIPIVDPHKTMIVFTGGEALVRKDIEQAGIQLYLLGFPWGIVSNGYLLTKERLTSLLNAGMRACTISLDGLKESHNWLRQNEQSFDRALNAIKMLPTTDLRHDVVTCVNNRNFDELPQIKQLLIDCGIKEWRIFTIFPVGRAANNPDLQLSDERFKAVFDFIVETRKEGKIDQWQAGRQIVEPPGEEQTDHQTAGTDDESNATVEVGQHRHDFVDLFVVVFLQRLVEEVDDAGANA